MMQVTLFAITRPLDGHENPMWVSENAACECYNSEPSENYRVAKGCAKTGHASVLEHINFTFHVTGVSRALLAQLSRHRHISLSVRSQRYCREDDFGYVNPFPPASSAAQYFEEAISAIQLDYSHLADYYDAAPEDARGILPNACFTSLWVTMNARALIEISHLRLCTRAQREIRELFKALKKSVEPYCPEIAKLMVPQCEKYDRPFCPEHNSCGRHPKLCDL